jgi:hypothetical protein
VYREPHPVYRKLGNICKSAWKSRRRSALLTNVLLEHAPLALAVLALVARGEWRGTAQKLLDELGPLTSDSEHENNFGRVSATCTGVAHVGIHITHERTAQRREIRISPA